MPLATSPAADLASAESTLPRRCTTPPFMVSTLTCVPFTRSSAKRAILVLEVIQVSLTAVFASWVMTLALSLVSSILLCAPRGERSRREKRGENRGRRHRLAVPHGCFLLETGLVSFYFGAARRRRPREFGPAGRERPSSSSCTGRPRPRVAVRILKILPSDARLLVAFDFRVMVSSWAASCLLHRRDARKGASGMPRPKAMKKHADRDRAGKVAARSGKECRVVSSPESAGACVETCQPSSQVQSFGSNPVSYQKTEA